MPRLLATNSLFAYPSFPSGGLSSSRTGAGTTASGKRAETSAGAREREREKTSSVAAGRESGRREDDGKDEEGCKVSVVGDYAGEASDGIERSVNRSVGRLRRSVNTLRTSSSSPA